MVAKAHNAKKDPKTSARPATPDHWDRLATELRTYFEKIGDDRAKEVYGQLFLEGWALDAPSALLASHPGHKVKRIIIDTLAREAFK